MVKKCPRGRAQRIKYQSPPPSVSKAEAAYWESRLFRNSFTYKGRSRQVKAWSIKIQLLGKRKTFSLKSPDRESAAVEACHIYQTLVTQGWEVAEARGGRREPLPATPATVPTAAPQFSEAHWKSNLIHRPYPELEPRGPERELSVRVGHASQSRYFPLGTSDDKQGVRKAREIHRLVVERGWEAAKEKYPFELTVAFRWLDDPLAWTYTTFHTWTSTEIIPMANQSVGVNQTRSVAIVEPDVGIRFALARCANRQPGFKIRSTFSNAAEITREIVRQHFDLVLVNHALPDQPGSTCLAQLRQLKPSTAGLRYSVFEDSDELFKSTPGGAAGYMLKRTSASRIFEPIADVSGPLSDELLATRIREYFQVLVHAMPTGPSLSEVAKLTPREHEILALLAKGEPTKRIAATLGISIWTVHGHIKSVFEKLQVHTRTEAVVKFLQK